MLSISYEQKRRATREPIPVSTADTCQPLLIGGRAVGTDGELIVTSPYDGEVVARVGYGDEGHAARALEVAHAALGDQRSAHARARVLERAAELLRARQHELADTMAREIGKPVALGRAEVERAAETFAFAASELRTYAGESIAFDAHPAGAHHIGFTRRLPAGVVVAITPFNFPLVLAAHKVAPAIATGCPVILKPADRAPLTAFALAEVLAEAGLAEGQLSVVLGPPDTVVRRLVADERVAVVSFTGSVAVGREIERIAAPRCRVLLELGSATPAIVLDDADIESAASALAPFAFNFAGQSCISVQRIYVQDAVHDRFLEALLDATGALGVGDPLDEDTRVGPLITPEARDRVVGVIENARAGGAQLVAGGAARADGILPPTVLTDCAQGTQVMTDEVFGPVVGLARIDSLETGIQLANATEFGMQAGVFTADYAAALRASDALSFAAVTINEAPGFRVDNMPYGGLRDSGNTREGPRYAMREMSIEQLLVLRR